MSIAAIIIICVLGFIALLLGTALAFALNYILKIFKGISDAFG